MFKFIWHIACNQWFSQNVPVNQSTQFHHYKSFFQTFINTTRGEKAAPLEIEAYYWEDGNEVDSKASESFKARMRLFQKDDNFVTSPIKLTGMLYHDLVSLFFPVLRIERLQRVTFHISVITFATISFWFSLLCHQYKTIFVAKMSFPFAPLCHLHKTWLY